MMRAAIELLRRVEMGAAALRARFEEDVPALRADRDLWRRSAEEWQQACHEASQERDTWRSEAAKRVVAAEMAEGAKK